ncbi:hypothetical protein QYF61_027532 [Mycteria americana]|uniref:ribonuclease H n=1 Tax=Mycteria americana TaxID=33587 RepID=A0AAN7PMW8_MYCAM|nr:hypothetical protein QYF61_027532 [Mycteria americana]
MLSEDKANGYWGPGVFLNLGPDPTNTPHSITSRVAYWTGGIDSMERGEPSIIPIKSLSELSTAVTKAACIQATHKQGPHDVPLSATVDFAMLKPLIRGDPAILKPHLVAKRDEIKKDTEHNEGLGDNAQNAHKQLPAWAELMYNIVDYSQAMGWDDAPAEKQNLKPWGGDHKDRPVKRGMETRSKGNKFKNPHTESRKQRNELWRNALALGIPRAAIQGQTTGVVLSQTEAFQKRNNGERKKCISTPSAPDPREGDNPFLSLREELSRRQLGLPVRKVEAYQWIRDNGPYILIPVGPQRQLVKFLIDMGAQISVLTQQDAEELGVRSGRKRVKITGVNGASVECQTAKINLWLPGVKHMSSTCFAIKDHHGNILGFYVLNRRTWHLLNGSLWSFGPNTGPDPGRNGEAQRGHWAQPLPSPSHKSLPYRNIPFLLWHEMESLKTHSPYTSPVWPVRKPDGRWRLTVDYRRLNANTAPLAAAVPDIANLTATVRAAAHPWMAALDVKDMFIMVPLKEEDKEKFAFTWEEYNIPLKDSHKGIVCFGSYFIKQVTVSLSQEVKLYQYIDDILIGGTSPEKVGEAAAAVWQALNKAEIYIPPRTCQGPSKEVIFLGTWWIAGSAVIPPDTLRKIEELQMPQSRKELQQLMETLGYWRKHVPGFSVISHPLYSLLQKGKPWEWKLEYKEVVKTLTEELKTY